MGLMLAVFLSIASCGGGHEIKKYSYAAQMPEVKAIVILQPEFYFRQMQSYQVFAKWMDFAHMIGSRTGAIVVGPDEVRVLVEGVVTSLAHETNVLTLLKKYGVKPENAVAIKFQLTESWQQVQSVISNEKSSQVGRVQFDSDFAFSGDVFRVDTSHPLFSVSHAVSQTISVSPTEGDSRPEITQYAKLNYAKVLGYLVRQFGVPDAPVGEPAVTLVENPLEALDYQYQTLPVLKDILEQKDEIERDAAIRSLITYRHPDLDRGHVRTLTKQREGILVTSAQGCSGLQAGDRVVKAAGDEVRRTYQFERAVRGALATGKQLSLDVVRDGSTVSVDYRCSR